MTSIAVPASGLAGDITGNAPTSDDFTRLLEVPGDLGPRVLPWMEPFDLFPCPVTADPAPSLLSPAPSRAGDSNIHNVTGCPVSVVRMGTSPEGPLIDVRYVAQCWKDHLTMAAAVFAELPSEGRCHPGIS